MVLFTVYEPIHNLFFNGQSIKKSFKYRENKEVNNYS